MFICLNCGKEKKNRYAKMCIRCYKKSRIESKNNPMYGKHHSAKTILKMCQSHKGYIPWNMGIPQTQETKFKISQSKIGQVAWNKGKKCPQLSGEKNPNWRGGQRPDGLGYILIYHPNHPHKSRNNYVFEHRLIMEKYLGRYLLPTEVVHHINEKVDDNRIENLKLFKSNKDHLNYHKNKPIH